MAEAAAAMEASARNAEEEFGKQLERVVESSLHMLQSVRSYKFEFPTPDDRPCLPIISFSDASFGYPGGPILFKNLNFGIDLSSRIAIGSALFSFCGSMMYLPTRVVGPNGIGKSTILKLIAGELQPSSGTVIRSAKVRIAVFSQHHVDGLNLTSSPLLYMMRCYPCVPEQRLCSHLGSFGVTGNLALQPMYTLSGGQKSRVAFAKITFKKPHIILLDEPLNHLDLDAVEALIQGLVLFQGGVLMVSHDEHLISGSVDELWVVSDGRVTPFHGTFADYKKISHTCTGDGVELRRRRGVSSITRLEGEAVNLSIVEWEQLSIVEWEQLSDYEKFKMMLDGSTKSNVFRRLKELAVPFMHKRCEAWCLRNQSENETGCMNPGMSQSFLVKWLTEISTDNSFDLCSLVMKEGLQDVQSRRFFRDEIEAIECGLQCIYKCPSLDSWYAMAGVLSKLLQLRLQCCTFHVKTLTIRMNTGKDHADAGRLLAKYQVPKPMNFFLDPNINENDVKQLFRLILSKFSRRQYADEDDDDWVALWLDMLTLHEKAFPFIDKEYILIEFCKGLLKAGKFALAKKYLICTTNVALPIRKIPNIIIHAAKEYSFSALSLAWSEVTSLTITNLKLIKYALILLFAFISYIPLLKIFRTY